MILFGQDQPRVNGFGERGPSGSRIKFVCRREERFTGNDVNVEPFVMVVPKGITKGDFRSVLLSNFELNRS